MITYFDYVEKFGEVFGDENILDLVFKIVVVVIEVIDLGPEGQMGK